MTISTGMFDANGTFDATGGSVTFSNAGNLKLASTVTSLGTLTAGSGTVTYDGTSDQTIATGVTYNTVALSGTGTKTAEAALTATTLTASNTAYSVILNGDGTEITYKVEFLNTGTVTLGNAAADSLTFSGGIETAENDSNPSATNLDGNILTSDDAILFGTSVVTGTSTINPAGGTVTFDTLTINDGKTLVVGTGDTGAISFGSTVNSASGGTGNLTINTDDTATLNAAVGATALGTLTLTDGDLNTNNQNITAANITVNGGVFNSHATNKAGTWAVENVTIGSSGTLKGTTGSFNVSGNWSNSGTFTSGSNTVTMDGSDTQTIGGTSTFNNLTIANTHTDNYVDASGSTLAVSNILNITNGKFKSASDYKDVTIGASGTLELSGNITVSGNWSNSGTFTHSNGTVTFDGSTAQGLTGSTTFYNLTLNNAAGITLNDNSIVDKSLGLTNGIVTLGDNDLTLGATATVSGTPSASKMVVTNGDGVLKKLFSAETGSFTFPVGDNTDTAEYSPATLNFTSGTFAEGAYASVNVKNTKQPNNTSTTDYLNRYWSVTQDGIISFSCDTTFNYLADDVEGTEADIYGGQYKDSAWTVLNAVDAANNWFQATVTGFSDFTGVEATTPTTQAANIGFSSVAQTQMAVNWTRGGGDKVLVVAHQGSAVDSNPVDGTTYTANAAFGSGTDIGGTGNYVVYKGTGTSVTVTGLTGATTYHFRAYEFDDGGVEERYITDTATGNPNNQTTLSLTAKVDLTGPATVTAGALSTVFTLTSQDADGNASNVTADTKFDLSSNSSGTKVFYSDAGGTDVITQVTITNGSSTATFYYKDSNSGTPTVTATWNSGGTDLGSDTLQITVSLAATTLATSTSIPLSFKDFKVTVTKIEMDNGTSWVALFSGTAELDLVNGGTFPGISGVSLPAGTYSRIRVTFRNSLPVTGQMAYNGTTYYTTAATFGGASNVASDPATASGSQTVFTFKIDDWGGLNAEVQKTFSITPAITVDATTDYQPTLRFSISTTFLLKGTADTGETYYLTVSEPTVSIVQP